MAAEPAAVIPRKDEPRLVGEDHGLDAVAQLELGQAVGDVGLDGGLADEQLSRDLGIAQPTPYEDEDLVLAPGQPVELACMLAVCRGRAVRLRLTSRRWCPGNRPACHDRRATTRHLLDDPAGDLRREEGMAAADDAHGVDEPVGLAVLEQEAARAGAKRVDEVVVAVETS